LRIKVFCSEHDFSGSFQVIFTIIFQK